MDDLEKGHYTEVGSPEELDVPPEEIDREAQQMVENGQHRVSAAETQ